MADYSDLDIGQLRRGIEKTLSSLSDYTTQLESLARTPLDPVVRAQMLEWMSKIRIKLEKDLNDLERAFREKIHG